MHASGPKKRFAAVIRHAPHEGLGLIEKSLLDAEVDFRYFSPGDPELDLLRSDFLIVMGGPWSVYDNYRWLEPETRLIRRAVEEEVPVLGICLGAQLIAAALGASVYPCGNKEIGWYPLDVSDAGRRDPLFLHLEARETVFQWHGDTFDLPAGAELLASSPLCPHQAFRYGRSTYALQFHLEVTAAMAAEWLQLPENVEEVDRLHGSDGVEQIIAGAGDHARRLAHLGHEVFAAFLGL
ncbi:MAG: type 1 glutamine amidotransferase [Thermoleophilia bacterium]